MAKREGKGGYAGGGAVVSPKDPTWFSKGSTRLRPDERSASIPPRTSSEQAAYEAFKRGKAAEQKYVLIKRKEDRPLSQKKKKEPHLP